MGEVSTARLSYTYFLWGGDFSEGLAQATRLLIVKGVMVNIGDTALCPVYARGLGACGKYSARRQLLRRHHEPFLDQNPENLLRRYHESLESQSRESLFGRLGFRTDTRAVSFQTFSQESFQEQHMPYSLATAPENERLLRIMTMR